MQKRAWHRPAPGERARLSAVAGGLLGRRGGVCRREEPPRDESGFRAHGSNQRFHRLLRHAVARALTIAPSLAGVSPAATRILTPHGWRRKGPPGTLLRKPREIRPPTNGGRSKRNFARNEVAVPVLEGFATFSHAVFRGALMDLIPVWFVQRPPWIARSAPASAARPEVAATPC